jgi:hypothetical protein
MMNINIVLYIFLSCLSVITSNHCYIHYSKDILYDFYKNNTSLARIKVNKTEKFLEPYNLFKTAFLFI